MGRAIDPTEGVSTPRIPQAIPKALTEAEVELLLSAVIGDDPRALRDRAILETLYATGMRISELAGLRLGDLDTSRGLAVAYGKGSKERLVPIGRHAVSALEAWLGPEGRGAMTPARWARRVDAEAVFISHAGRRMSRQAVWQVVTGGRHGRSSSRTGCRPTCSGTRARPTCSSTGPTSEWSRSCSGTRPSRRRRSTRRSRPSC